VHKMKALLSARRCDRHRDYIANVSATNEAGLAFLAANKEKEGVVTLPSGLQYKELSAGTGTEHPATGTYAPHVITPTPPPGTSTRRGFGEIEDRSNGNQPPQPHVSGRYAATSTRKRTAGCMPFPNEESARRSKRNSPESRPRVGPVPGERGADPAVRGAHVYELCHRHTKLFA